MILGGWGLGMLTTLYDIVIVLPSNYLGMEVE